MESGYHCVKAKYNVQLQGGPINVANLINKDSLAHAMKKKKPTEIQGALNNYDNNNSSIKDKNIIFLAKPKYSLIRLIIIYKAISKNKFLQFDLYTFH